MFALRAVKTVSKNGGLSMLQSRSKYKLPPLPYRYNDLEPVISGEIMELHYQKHHAGYVNNLNTHLEELEQAIKNNNVDKIANLQKGILFNAGGHINHSIFWNNLCPPGLCKPPPSPMLTAICDSFGSYEQLVNSMSALAVSIQGSGWAWLAFNPVTKLLELKTCKNQDPLQATTGCVPLLGIDVWEHAYYLQYKNVRADYVKKIWEIVNWQDVTNRYTQCKGQLKP